MITKGLLVTSQLNQTVREYNGTTGAFVKVAASGGALGDPLGLVIGLDGNLLVSDGTLVRISQRLLFSGEATEFGQELGPYSQGFGRGSAFHLQPVCGLVHPGQRLKECLSTRRCCARFFQFAKRSANPEFARRLQAARGHQPPKSSLNFNSHGHER
jgi:hypothetical protein